MNLTENIRWHARFRPGKPAIVEGASTITYASLDRRINGLCSVLKKLGVRRESLVGVGMRDDAEHIIMLLTLARMGAVLLPIDRRWNVAEKRGVIERFAADHVFLSQDDDDLLEGCLCPAADWFAESDEPYLDPDVTARSPLVLSLSSGTTGLPKGPRLTHEQLVNRYMVYWLDIGMNAQDRFVVATPLYFGGGRGFALAMLWAGGTIDMFTPPYSAEELVEHVNENRATALFLVPTLLRRVLALSEEKSRMPGLRILISSGSVLYGNELIAVRRQITPNLYQYYASTEAGGVSILGPTDYEGREDSVGRPCFRVEIEVVDDEHNPVPAGTLGRLRYRSPASPDQYYLGENAEAFRDGFFYPGDLAVLDENGYLYLKGRSKDVIIRGGVNIYPGDIEVVLQEAPGVVEAAVISVPSAVHGEEIVAFVATSAPVDEATLIALCKERLARFKVPKQIIFLDNLPRNAAGKVLKKDLQRRFES